MTSINKKELKKAIHDSMGIITVVAKRIGKTRQGLYYYLKQHPDMQALLDDERESLKDFAESMLITNVKNGDVTSIIFLLKTLAKDRGYVERHELAGAKDQPLEIEVTVINDENFPSETEDQTS
jgi:hypothetical protein